MNSHICLLTAWLVAASTMSGLAGGLVGNQLTIGFTNIADATNKATWADPDRLTISKDGLGWDGEAAASRDGWIQTTPLAVGYSWRAPSSMNVSVELQPGPKEIKLRNGKKTTPYPGQAYVRHSPDLEHWSSWQALRAGAPQTPPGKTNAGSLWSGSIRVPHRDRGEYGRLLSDYSRLDVPWKSDEEAAVQWILEREPDFFAKQLPFIGYVEFLFEGGFHGGQRIRSLEITYGYSVGGLHSPPREPDAGKGRYSIPWRFKAKSKLNTQTISESGLESTP